MVDKNKKEIAEIIYTPLRTAKKEIWKRWNNKELKRKVEDFLKGDVPEFLKDEPKAYLARHIASPNFEFVRFIELAELIDLKPVCPHYLSDKFSAENIDKYHLGKLFFNNGRGKKGGEKVSTLRIIDFNKVEGKQFKKIKTLWEENFIDFHRRILKLVVPGIDKSIFDISSWLKKKGKNPKKFYIYFLALFICHGVLFENFLTNKDEKYFSRKIVIPNFEKLVKIFGVKPLIVPIYPFDYENNIYWKCYPEKVKKMINI